MSTQTLRAIVLAGGLLLSYTAVAFVRSTYQAELLPPAAPMTAIPLQLGECAGREVETADDTVQVMGAHSFINRTYRLPGGHQIVLHAAAFTDPEYIGTAPHHPTVCYPAAGWKIIERQSDTMEVDGEDVPIEWILFQKDAARIVTAHWFRTGEDVFTGSEGFQTQMASWGQSTRPCIEKFLVQVAQPSIDRAKPIIQQFLPLVENAWREVLSEKQSPTRQGDAAGA
jgi:EpsI family protein